MPGADAPIRDEDVAALVEALDQALAGEDPVVVPRPTPWSRRTSTSTTSPAGPRTGDSVRVPTRRVHDLLDIVGEAELESRRVERQVAVVAAAGGRARRLGQDACATPPSVATACPPTSPTPSPGSSRSATS